MNDLSWGRERNCPVPFDIFLEGGGAISCRELLRVLPGRRVVCRAETDGRQLLVKVFPGKRGAREARRERRGAEALRSVGVDSPRLVLEGSVAETGWPLVAYEYLGDSRSLGRALATEGASGRERLLEKVTRMIARQHAGGLWQQDLHLDNFLVDREQRIWAIDAGGYRSRRRPLGRRTSMDRLGLFVAQFPAGFLPVLKPVLASYCQARGADWDPQRLEPLLERSVWRWYRWRAAGLGRKSMRDCTEFATGRVPGFRLVRRRELDAGLLENWIFGGGLEPGPGCRMLKEGHSQTVWSTRLGEIPVVVKRYNVKGRWHALRRTLAGERAGHAWKAAHWLRAYGIATPRPLALIREERGLLAGRAWLVTEAAAGLPAHKIPEAGDFPPVKELARLVVRLGRCGLVHGDMKASNFIVGEEGIQVIDLDSLSRPRWRWLRERGVRADRERFLRNWKDPELRAAFEAALAEAEAERRLC